MMSGDANVMVVTSTIGSRASAAKLKNMPATEIMPRPEMPERARGAERAGEFAPPRVDQHHRNDREERAAEHHLARAASRR